MRSNLIDDIEVQLQTEYNLIELYSDLNSVGCFSCSDQQQHSDQCIDICASDQSQLTRSEWNNFFEDSNDQIDLGCGHVIMSLFSPATQTSVLQFSDVLQFAESLVFDENQNRCYAYDPRDEYKRRLQAMDKETCQAFDCFNCAYTAGQCEWDSVLNMCDKPARPIQQKRGK